MNRNPPTDELDPGVAPGIATAYRLLQAEIDQLRRARHAIDDRLRKAIEAHNLLGQLLHKDPQSPEHPETDLAIGKRFHSGSRTEEVVRRAQRLIVRAGRPLGRSELLRMIIDDGFDLDVNDPARFIGRALWQDPRFIHIPKQGYWIKGAEPPGGGP